MCLRVAALHGRVRGGRSTRLIFVLMNARHFIHQHMAFTIMCQQLFLGVLTRACLACLSAALVASLGHARVRGETPPGNVLATAGTKHLKIVRARISGDSQLANYP